MEQIKQLLLIPLKTYKSELIVIKLQHYTPFVNFLKLAHRKEIAGANAKCALEAAEKFQTPNQVDRLFTFLAPLVKDPEPATITETAESDKDGDALPKTIGVDDENEDCLLYTSPSPRDKRQSRMPSSA